MKFFMKDVYPLYISDMGIWFIYHSYVYELSWGRMYKYTLCGKFLKVLTRKSKYVYYLCDKINKYFLIGDDYNVAPMTHDFDDYKFNHMPLYIYYIRDQNLDNIFLISS